MVRKRLTARIPVKPSNGTPTQYVRGRCRSASEEGVAVSILDGPALTLWPGRARWKMCGFAQHVCSIVPPLVRGNDIAGAEQPGVRVERFTAPIFQSNIRGGPGRRGRTLYRDRRRRSSRTGCDSAGNVHHCATCRRPAESLRFPRPRRKDSRTMRTSFPGAGSPAAG